MTLGCRCRWLSRHHMTGAFTLWVASVFLSVFQIVDRRLGKLIIKREVYNGKEKRAQDSQTRCLTYHKVSLSCVLHGVGGLIFPGLFRGSNLILETPGIWSTYVGRSAPGGQGGLPGPRALPGHRAPCLWGHFMNSG